MFQTETNMFHKFLLRVSRSCPLCSNIRYLELLSVRVVRLRPVTLFLSSPLLSVSVGVIFQSSDGIFDAHAEGGVVFGCFVALMSSKSLVTD